MCVHPGQGHTHQVLYGSECRDLKPENWNIVRKKGGWGGNVWVRYYSSLFLVSARLDLSQSWICLNLMPFILILFRGVEGALQYKCSKNDTVGAKISMKFNCSFCILQPQTEREWPTPEMTPVSSRKVIFVPLTYNVFDAGLTVVSFYLVLLL